MQDFSITLDGAPVAAIDFDGTDGARVTIEQRSGESAISFANAITFFGDARAYILAKLVNGANPQIDFVTIAIYDNCCQDANGAAALVFIGRSTRADIEFCDPEYNEDCGVTCTLSDASVAADKIKCVRDVLITQRNYNGRSSRGEDSFRDAVDFGYYEETRPKSFMYIMLYLVTLLLVLYLPIIAIITLLSFGLVDTSALYNGLLGVLLKKKKHRAPFIHSYLHNICTLCGLSLRSSLFNAGGNYHNLTRLDAGLQEGEGALGGQTTQEIYRTFNSPNITLIELMRTLEPLNITYLVTDTELIVERKDYFGGNVWVDLATRREDLLLSPCFTPSDENQPAIEIFKYAEDGSDKIGNEVLRLWSGDPVDYNTPVIPSLRGVRQTVVQYGAARFLGDSLPSVINSYLSSTLVNILTLGGINVSNGSMLMTTGTCSVPKLLMYDGASDPEDAQVEVYFGAYNGRVWLRDDMPTAYGGANFYDNLLRINNPRLNLQRNLNYTARFSYNCEDIRTRSFGQVAIIPFFGQSVVARIDTIEIDFDNREITISGLI